ncbi:hypothetical protein [Streptomyces sp. NPDC101237]|uniref:hypothetical protein n=1 Tax=Streptomyces sp. NPDC101237 TaxID=3366139 RepID=UPI003810F4FA
MPLPELLRLLHGGTTLSSIAAITWSLVAIFKYGVVPVMQIRAATHVADRAYDLANDDPMAAVALRAIEKGIPDASSILDALRGTQDQPPDDTAGSRPACSRPALHPRRGSNNRARTADILRVRAARTCRPEQEHHP